MIKKFQTKHISDLQVLEAVDKFNKQRDKIRNYHYDDTDHDSVLGYIQELTNAPSKVCLRALERFNNRGYYDYGTTIAGGWLTDEGKKLLEQSNNIEDKDIEDE